MDNIYNILERYPEYMRGPVLALCLICIGYIVAKIIAALLLRFIPSNIETGSGEYSKDPFKKRISKFCFWLIWTPCFFIAVIQFLPELDPINGAQFNVAEDWETILLLNALALTLLLSEPFWKQNLHRFKNLFEATPRYFILLPIAASLIALFIFPEANFLPKLFRSILLLTVGLVLSKLAKEVVLSGLDVIDIQSEHLSKFVYYFFMSIVLLVTASIWISQ